MHLVTTVDTIDFVFHDEIDLPMIFFFSVFVVDQNCVFFCSPVHYRQRLLAVVYFINCVFIDLGIETKYLLMDFFSRVDTKMHVKKVFFALSRPISIDLCLYFTRKRIFYAIQKILIHL